MKRENQAPHFTLLLFKIESVHILFPYLLLQISSSIEVRKWPTGFMFTAQTASHTRTLDCPPPPHCLGWSLLVVHDGIDYTNSQSKVNCCQEPLPTRLGEDCIFITLWGPLQPSPEQVSHRHAHTLLHCWGQSAFDVCASCFPRCPAGEWSTP